MRNNKGVTLVALVITIIVLLILAGVSLAMLTGDSGILTNADQAKKDTAISNAESSIQMAYMDIKTEVYAIEVGSSNLTAMTADEMVKIAKRYCPEATIDPVNGSTAITIDYSLASGSDKVSNDDLKVATITYNASASPRVSLSPATLRVTTEVEPD